MLKTVPYDEALLVVKRRFPAGVYRLRTDLLNPELDQGQGPAWYQQSILTAGTIFLIRYDRTKEGKERLHLRPRGLSPAITSLSRSALLQALLERLERLTGQADLETELELMGLFRIDILQALLADGWSSLQIGDLLGKAKRRAKIRQADEERRKIRKEKLKQRGQPSRRPPDDITRPLEPIPQVSESPPPRSLKSRVFTNSVHQALAEITDVGGDPVRLDLPGSSQTMQVGTEAIEAVEIVERSTGAIDPDQTKPDFRLPEQSMTVQQMPSEELLGELAMPKGEKE